MPSSPLLMLSNARPSFLIFIATLVARSILAHPIPDIPVHSSFDGKAGVTIRIEIDPRCFELDPNKAPSMLTKDLAPLPGPKKAELKSKAEAYAARAVQFFFEPGQQVKPAFQFQFTSQENVPLAKPDDIVVLTGTWSSPIPNGAKTYHIKATPEGTLSVLNFNEARGQRLERFQVLFPGEIGYKLDLQTLQPVGPATAEISASDKTSEDESGMTSPTIKIPSWAVAIGAIALIGVVVLIRGRKS